MRREGESLSNARREAHTGKGARSAPEGERPHVAERDPRLAKYRINHLKNVRGVATMRAQELARDGGIGAQKSGRADLGRRIERENPHASCATACPTWEAGAWRRRKRKASSASPVILMGGSAASSVRPQLLLNRRGSQITTAP